MEGEIPGPIQLCGFAGRPNWGGLDGLLYPVLCIVCTSMRARFGTGTGVRELGLWLSPRGEKNGIFRAPVGDHNAALMVPARTTGSHR